jgi:hypothetical protein
MAVSMLQGALKKFGREVLISALCCITKTRRGNPGMIRVQIIDALCAVIETEPAFLSDRARLVKTMQTFDFNAQFNDARKASIESGAKVSALLVEAIGEHLDGFHVAQPEKSVGTKAPKEVSAGGTNAIEVAGGVLELADGKESVTFKGQTANVSPRGARLVLALAKVRPDCIGDDFLISRIWKVKPTNVSALLEMVVSDLAGLKKIGLEVRTQRGIGRQLVETKR